MKIRITESQYKRLLTEQTEENSEIKELRKVVVKIIKEFCAIWNSKSIEPRDIPNYLNKHILSDRGLMGQLEKDITNRSEKPDGFFAKLILNEKNINFIGEGFINQALNNCVRRSDGRVLLTKWSDKIKERLNGIMKKTDQSDPTKIVANFDKEKVTDDLANKTIIKDGVVHVPFAIDDFPTEDWDIYFEDFNVSNQIFGFTDYVVKEYGAGEKDAKEIWQEYQEAVLHRIMDEK